MTRAITRRAGREAGSSAVNVAARLALLSEQHVNSWIDWTPVGPDAVVVDLPARHKPTGTRSAGAARVISFPAPRTD
jgi:hypothetical protein